MESRSAASLPRTRTSLGAEAAVDIAADLDARRKALMAAISTGDDADEAEEEEAIVIVVLTLRLRLRMEKEEARRRRRQRVDEEEEEAFVRCGQDDATGEDDEVRIARLAVSIGATNRAL
jgi:hypothetical protein